MKPIALRLFPVRKSKDRTSERGELVQFFLDKLNPGRARDGYKPLTPAALGVKLSHLSKSDLYYLKSICLDAETRGGSFAKTFLWSITAKREQ